jgi:hypothetical protein
MVGVPETFSIASFAQEIPRAVVTEIDAFVTIFDEVTGRAAWQNAVTAEVRHLDVLVAEFKEFTPSVVLSSSPPTSGFENDLLSTLAVRAVE